MQCPSCRLRYNSVERIPRIIGCGHSLCSSCVTKNNECVICETKINPQSKTNYSLMELVEKDNNNIDKFIKICFVGSSGVGKTSLIRMLTNHQFSQDISSTVGYDFTFQDIKINGFNVRFQFWDSAGQQRYRAISPIHYKNANIVVVVYDVNCEQEKNKIEYWLSESEKHCPKEVKIILVGNKLDLLQGKMAKSLQKQTWERVKKNEIQLSEVCCKKGLGHQKMWGILEQYFRNRREIEKIGEKVLEKGRKRSLRQIKRVKQVQIKKKQVKQKQYCC